MIPLEDWKGDKRQEAENRAWDQLLAQYGAHALEEKMRRMPVPPGEHINSYNAYNRKWPFDAKKKLVGLELVQDFIPDEHDSLDAQLIAREEHEAFINSLTEKQRFVVERTSEGYKPREIAEMQGDSESGKVRWHLFASRRKLKREMGDEHE